MDVAAPIVAGRKPHRPRPARPPSPKQQRKAAELRASAEAAYKADRPGEALTLFEAANGLVADVDLLLRIADCHRALGNAGRAAYFYRTYLRQTNPDLSAALPPARGSTGDAAPRPQTDLRQRSEIEELAQQMEALVDQVRGPRNGASPTPAPQ